MTNRSFSTDEVARGTGLSTRQIQHHAEKGVMFIDSSNVGRGTAYKFTTEDIIKYLIIRECVQFNLSYDIKKQVVQNYVVNLRKKDDVKEFIDQKLFLKDKFLYMWIERPLKGKHEEVFGYLISDSGKDFDSCYFRPLSPSVKGPQFNGFKLENHSMSVFMLDLAAILKKHHFFLQEIMESGKGPKTKGSASKNNIAEKGSTGPAQDS